MLGTNYIALSRNMFNIAISLCENATVWSVNNMWKQWPLLFCIIYKKKMIVVSQSKTPKDQVLRRNQGRWRSFAVCPCKWHVHMGCDGHSFLYPLHQFHNMTVLCLWKTWKNPCRPTTRWCPFFFSTTCHPRACTSPRPARRSLFCKLACCLRKNLDIESMSVPDINWNLKQREASLANNLRHTQMPPFQHCGRSWIPKAAENFHNIHSDHIWLV